MSANYENEQQELKRLSEELGAVIQQAEQNTADTEHFVIAVRKYTEIIELIPEIMHELIEKIVVHALEKVDGKRTQQIDIYYRFNVSVSITTVTNGMKKLRDETQLLRKVYFFCSNCPFRGAVETIPNLV